MPGAEADPSRLEPESAPGHWLSGAAQKSGGSAKPVFGQRNEEMCAIMFIIDFVIVACFWAGAAGNRTFFLEPEPTFLSMAFYSVVDPKT